MELEIKDIVSAFAEEFPAHRATRFSIALRVEIGERGKPGAETFHFLAASPTGLEGELGEKGFRQVRGLILLAEFDLEMVHRAIDNLIQHSRSLRTWDEVVRFFNRYGRYDSEDLNGIFSP